MKSSTATTTSPQASARGSPEPARPASPAAAAEAAVVFTLVILYIWVIQPLASWFWMVPLGLVIASHLRRGESLAFLGFRPAHPWRAFRDWGPWTLGAAVAFAGVGLDLHTYRRHLPLLAPLGIFLGYCVWALFQQYILNGYFVNRIRQALGARAAPFTPLLAGAVFSAVHAPNRFLMLVTFAAGWLCAVAYLRYRNLYFLAVAHALIGTVLVLVVPHSIAHGFIVGPNMR